MSIFKRKVNQNSHTARDSNLSKKIDKKLDFVAETTAYALGDRHVQTESSLFHKRIFLQKFRYLSFLDMKYNYENRMVSISYNLELSSEIPINEPSKEFGNCVFEAKSKGKVNVKDAFWICSQHPNNDADIEKCLERLNNKLIIDRIIALDMQKIRVIHTEGSPVWNIYCESMIGSSTWILIPPVISLIKPKPEECGKFVEFFELVSDAIINNA